MVAGASKGREVTRAGQSAFGGSHRPGAQKRLDETGNQRDVSGRCRAEDAMPKQNPFYATVGRTPAGSFRITIRAKNPKDRASGYRQMAVCAYKLAAEMERRTDALGAHWSISPQVFDQRIDVELGDDDAEQAAGRFVQKVLSDSGLL